MASYIMIKDGESRMHEQGSFCYDILISYIAQNYISLQNTWWCFMAGDQEATIEINGEAAGSLLRALGMPWKGYSSHLISTREVCLLRFGLSSLSKQAALPSQAYEL